jgi:vitamin B12 transporter
MKVFALFFSFLVFSFNFCLADNPPLEGENQQGEAIRLEPIVVTPYKVAISSFQSPASVEEILVEEADSKGVSGLADSLKNIPSVSYSITGGLGGTSGISIRGAEVRHTQVMYDEIKLYDPIVTSSYFYAYNYMSLDNLEKIEVAKGPYSSLYGSDSIGGTIRLLPRKGKGKPTASFTQEIGSYQTYREKLSLQGEVDKLNYSLAVSRKDVNDFYAGKYKEGNYETDPFSSLNAALRLDYSLSDNLEVGLISDYTYAKYEYDASGGTDDNDNYAYFYQGLGGISLRHQLADSFSHKLNFGYTRTYRKSWEDEDTHAWYNGKTYQAKWQGNYQVCDFDKVIFGFDYLREAGESRYDSVFGVTLTPNQTANTKGYYIQNIFTPLDNLFLSASFRLEDHSQFDTHNTFSVSGSYIFEPTNTKIKASFGEGFKAPSIYQLYDSSSGNSSLNPEKSESYDLGFEQKVGDLLIVGSTYFHTHIKNLIEWTPDFPGAWTGEYDNIGKARIWGLENFLKYNFNDNSNLKLSYTYMDTEDKSDGSRLLRRPDNKVVISFNTLINKLKISSDLSYVGNRIDYPGTVKLKSYILGNLSFNYQVNDNLNTFLRFENILDDDYELVEGYQTPEFSWYLGAKYTF